MMEKHGGMGKMRRWVFSCIQQRWEGTPGAEREANWWFLEFLLREGKTEVEVRGKER